MMSHKLPISIMLLLCAAFIFSSCTAEQADVKRHFDFDIVTEKYREDVNIGEKKSILLHLQREGNYAGETYRASFFIRDGHGTLSDETDNVLEENAFYEVHADGFKVNYTPHEKGSHKIEVTVKDSSGITKELQLDFSAE